MIKFGDLLLSREKSYMNTDVGERFPIKIAFTRRLTEDEFQRLAVYAYMIEKDYSTDSALRSEKDD